MTVIFKYLKTLLYILIPILLLNILFTLLYYFNVIGNGTINYFKLLIAAISMLIGGIYIGSKASKKGWLEGLKVGIEVVMILLIFSIFVFNQKIDIKTIIYYFILLASSMLGSMIGINRKKGT